MRMNREGKIQKKRARVPDKSPKAKNRVNVKCQYSLIVKNKKIKIK